ncbi:hypothetical protein K490DRAFT_70433 [Saccharata proteae CBS 121410]|uniref:Pyruvate carboxylase n=1 Tax=Saccharata proteae CBS 121410 TaxID=1314787 RepID=A0A9P4LZY6_9PEZI|nr:hypothetical protein K490DRAFT_70433 [Saccharata proteae CBS 121410]
MSLLPRRPIKRLLVSNRGEIATRILSTARELDIETYAIYTPGDASHAYSASHAVEISSPKGYVDIPVLVALVKKHGIDAVHPGYGFLSESPEFAKHMWEGAGAVVVGPGWEILERTGDKVRARELAARSDVPILPGLESPTTNPGAIEAFAAKIGLPIMIKPVDEGGGHGITLIRNVDDLRNIHLRRERAPPRAVFAEKAAIDGFRHVEVQIIGDGKGGVCHLFERECSIQTGYRKVVEIAPSMIADRDLISRVIDAAMRIARKVNYYSLGTFEFLVNPSTREYYFLEINPRIQVEHTVTESICMLDIVKIQLMLAQGSSLTDAGLPEQMPPPRLHSIQLRLTAQDFPNPGPSIGKIKAFQFPSGNGVRVDSHLNTRCTTTVGADFDVLLAKIIITAPSWPGVISKAKRALEDTCISGVKTNLVILKAIVAHPDFATGACDTRWLEANTDALIHAGNELSSSSRTASIPSEEDTASSAPTTDISNSDSISNFLLREGDSWDIQLSTPGPFPTPFPPLPGLRLELTHLIRHAIPTSLSAEIAYTTLAGANPTKRVLSLVSIPTPATSRAHRHRRGSPTDPSHVCIPSAGKLLGMAVEEGEIVREGDVVCVVQQMKMELEVRAQRAGRVVWVTEAEDGEEVVEGTLAAVLELEDGDGGGTKGGAKL